MIGTFYQSSVFKYYFNKLCFQLPQNVIWTDEITRAIRTRTGINEARLAHHISLASMISYLFLLYFLKQYLVGNIQGKFRKKSIDNFYFLFILSPQEPK